MPYATQAFHNRLALIFDFDGTLAPDAIDQLLKLCDLDPERFHQQDVNPLVEDGWDALIATFYALLRLADREDKLDLTRDHLKEVAQQVTIFDGVADMFGQIRQWVGDVDKDIEVEFYLLSSGFIDIYRHVSISEEFNGMWGSEFYFGEDGRARFVKQIITHPEKQRYLLQLAKGLGVEGPNGPSNVYQEVSAEDWHVPLDQMIYVGDGTSDMPAFSLLNDYGGIALGVVDAEHVKDWDGYSEMYGQRRVQNLAPADYAQDSELMRSLRLSVESIAKLIALRKLGIGE